MEKAIDGRLRYDEDRDVFVYEIRSDGKWGMCMEAQCVRREGAEEGEEADFVHFGILKRMVYDAQVFGVKLSLA